MVNETYAYKNELARESVFPNGIDTPNLNCWLVGMRQLRINKGSPTHLSSQHHLLLLLLLLLLLVLTV